MRKPYLFIYLFIYLSTPCLVRRCLGDGIIDYSIINPASKRKMPSTPAVRRVITFTVGCFFLMIQPVAGFVRPFLQSSPYPFPSPSPFPVRISSGITSESEENPAKVDPRVTQQQIAAIQRFQTLAEKTCEKQLEEYSNIHSIIKDIISAGKNEPPPL